MTAACAVLHAKLRTFVDSAVYPLRGAFSEHAQSDSRWQSFPQMEALKSAARAEGLWNLWISKDLSKCLQKLLQDSVELAPAERLLLAGPGLSNVDYAHLAKVMGEVPWCSEVFNCRC
jgi:acyl-CoA dehydrogenase